MISVVLITKNEADNIDTCLQSVLWADEIIMVDSGSTDDTVNKAKKYGIKIYEASWQGFGLQKQLALSYATQDWVLNIDADEVVSSQLASEIKCKLVKYPDVDAWQIPIKMSFYGKTLKYALKTNRHIRLFRRSHASYSSDPVHEKIILPKNCKIARMKRHIIHESYKDLSEALYKMNYYSSLTAMNKYKKAGFKKSIIAVLLSSLWMFIRCYIIQLGFIDGKAGLLMAIYFSHGSFYRGMKNIYPDKAYAK